MRNWLIVCFSLLALLSGIATKTRAQSSCAVQFFKETFDPPFTPLCSDPNKPSCYSHYDFSSNIGSLATGTNVSQFPAGKFAMLGDGYTYTDGTRTGATGLEYCVAAQLYTYTSGSSAPYPGGPTYAYHVTHFNPDIWSYNLTVAQGKSGVSFSFDVIQPKKIYWVII